MTQPCRVKADDPDRAPLNCDIQRLVMRVVDDLAGGDVAGSGRSHFEQLPGRAGAMTDHRSFSEKLQRLLPVFEPKSDRGRYIPLLVELVVPDKGLGGPAQLRRG